MNTFSSRLIRQRTLVAFVVLSSLTGVAIHAQNISPDPFWQKLAARPAAAASPTNDWVQPQIFNAVALDHAAMQTALARSPLESAKSAATVANEITLPMPDGTYQRFDIIESPVMEPELAAKFPEIKTYVGQGIDDPAATVRLDQTPAGFHAQVLSPNGAVYIDPYFRDRSVYASYYKKDYRKAADEFQCLTPAGENITPLTSARAVAQLSSGLNLRTYRLACAADGEYTTYQGGTVAAGMAAIVTAVNRVTGVYETELAIRLVLVVNNNLLVYTNSATDPYSNSSASLLLSQNQSNIDAIIGTANYDIGHVFTTGGGGLAGLGVVCTAGQKSRGETGLSAPTGDSFYIDYVAHEMGHQFGGNHTFNSSAGSCGGGNRNASTAYEPGSGSTIMAYAGICSSDNLQLHSDPYFHSISFDEIIAYSTTGSGNSCPVTTATGNSVPTISAGASYTIPQGTPFALTASGSDGNGDTLTYCWEERDLGATTTLTTPDNGSSPIFRSFNATTNPVRTFPKLSDVLNNTVTSGEQLPTTSRTMSFRVTVRDNRAGGGGVNTADTSVTVNSNAGPFAVTAPNSGGAFAGGLLVTWNVAGTTVSPVSTANVKISLSTNGGLDFPIILAASTPNDGTEIVVLPNITTSTARVKVEGVGNIFFDICNTNFSITPGVPTPYVSLDSTLLTGENCAPTNNAIDPDETVTIAVALKNTGSANTTNLVVTLLSTNGVTAPSGPVAYGALIAGGAAVTQSFSFTATGACGGNIIANLQFQDGALNLGNASRSFGLGAASAATNSFTNATSFTILDASPASLYPSTISVAGMAGTINKVTVALRGLTHTWAGDMDVLLVNPSGQKLLIMSDATDNFSGGGTFSNATMIFDDDAATSIPASGALSPGTYKPTNITPGDHVDSDTFSSPAPGSPYGSTLSIFNGSSPNGTWSLYIMDDAGGDSGTLAQGWSLTISAATSGCCTGAPAPSANLAIGKTVSPALTNVGGNVTFTLNITNLGPNSATSIVVTDTLPAGLTFVSATNNSGTVSNNSGTVIASISSLISNATAIITLQVSGSTTGVKTNTVTIASATADAVSTNNTAKATVTIVAPPTISSFNVVSTNLSLTWVTLAGQNYRVQYKTNLNQPAWVDLTGNIPAAGATLSTNLPIVGSQRFYRIAIGP